VVDLGFFGRLEAELEPEGFFPSGPVRLKSGRFIFDVKLTKIRQKSGFVQPDELAKIRFRPAG
jgi:hypothetical protein